MDRIFAKNTNRMKTLEERLHDAEDQAIQASRRVRKFWSKKVSSTRKLQSLTHLHFTKLFLELLNYPKTFLFFSWTSLLWNQRYHPQNRTKVLTTRKCHSQTEQKYSLLGSAIPKQNTIVMFWEWQFRLHHRIVLL